LLTLIAFCGAVLGAASLWGKRTPYALANSGIVRAVNRASVMLSARSKQSQRVRVAAQLAQLPLAHISTAPSRAPSRNGSTTQLLPWQRPPSLRSSPQGKNPT
jgi:hypothetical protein